MLAYCQLSVVKGHYGLLFNPSSSVLIFCQSTTFAVCTKSIVRQKGPKIRKEKKISVHRLILCQTSIQLINIFDSPKKKKKLINISKFFKVLIWGKKSSQEKVFPNNATYKIFYNTFHNSWVNTFFLVFILSEHTIDIFFLPTTSNSVKFFVYFYFVFVDVISLSI